MGFYERFAEFQLDVLQEVGNIGSGNAATALSILLNKPVNMKVPRVRMLPFEEISELFGGAEEVVVAVFSRVEGDAPGNLFFIISLESARHLLQILVGFPAEETGRGQVFTEMEVSALCEIGNILSGSYLSSLGDFTGLNFVPSVPAIALDMIGAVLSHGVMMYGAMGEHALFIETFFSQGQHAVEGHYFFIPDPDSYAKLFEALGVPLA